MTKKELRIIFMGTPEFAVSSLKALIDNDLNVVGVITAPDKRAGRGKKVRMSAVKQFAIDRGLNILQPTNLKDEEFITELRHLSANLQIVVAFRMLPKIVWQMPDLGTFNLHASLLPQYRGAAPINYAIINGEKQTGLTTFFLDEKIDTGKIILQEKIEISSKDSFGTLHDNMMNKSGVLVIKTINAIVNNEIEPVSQSLYVKDNKVLHEAPKINKEDCLINWNNDSLTNYNFIRGLSPYPAAYSTITSNNNAHTIKIFETEIATESTIVLAPGEINTDGKTTLYVGTGDGSLCILELQLSGKKRMKTADFLRGFQKISEYNFVVS